MKLYIRLTILLLIVHVSNYAQNASIRGLYVDDFISILGNEQKEDSLLNYAYYNEFNYLALYDVFQIHTANSLTDTATAKPLARFIKKAKQEFLIHQVGAIGENYWFFNTIIQVYNSQHPDLLEQFDVFNLEFQFWDTPLVQNGGTLCNAYLTPNGFNCDTSGAFDFYISELHSIDSIANLNGKKSETFVGWFNQGQGASIAANVDRVLLHDYVNDYSQIYSQVSDRLEFLASAQTKVNVVPLFSAESIYLQNWLSTNSIDQAFNDLSDTLATVSDNWANFINLHGFHWFTYTHMPYSDDNSSIMEAVSVDSIRGLYVDGFKDILGNINQEDSLLQYAQDSGFNHLALYDLFPIHNNAPLTNVTSSQPLADFIKKAKTQYNIQTIAATAENFEFFNNVIHVYNTQHSDPLEKFDVYNVEFEFWNTDLVNPNGTYCNDYLSPNSLNCDTADAFIFYLSILRQVDSLANANGITSETYIGFINKGQGQQIANMVDRIFVHVYINNYQDLYANIRDRLSFLSSFNSTVSVLPIFSAESNFMGPWLNGNSLTQPCSNIIDSLDMETGVWANHVSIIGCNWFAYSFMPHPVPDTTISVSNSQLSQKIDLKVYPNPANNYAVIKSSSPKPIEARIIDTFGRHIKTLYLSDTEQKIDLSDFTSGTYFINYRNKKDDSFVERAKLIIYR